MTVADFDFGLLLGLLIAQGHFGGDRKQPQVTLKLHVSHLPLLEWAFQRLPGARLYGPYEYGPRRFYQLMVRGEALRDRLIPLLDTAPWATIDPHSYARYEAMKQRYGLWSYAAPAALPLSRSDGRNAPGNARTNASPAAAPE